MVMIYFTFTERVLSAKKRPVLAGKNDTKKQIDEVYNNMNVIIKNYDTMSGYFTIRFIYPFYKTIRLFYQIYIRLNYIIIEYHSQNLLIN
jgi:hypothetical protein